MIEIQNCLHLHKGLDTSTSPTMNWASSLPTSGSTCSSSMAARSPALIETCTDISKLGVPHCAADVPQHPPLHHCQTNGFRTRRPAVRSHFLRLSPQWHSKEDCGGDIHRLLGVGKSITLLGPWGVMGEKGTRRVRQSVMCDVTNSSISEYRRVHHT